MLSFVENFNFFHLMWRQWGVCKILTLPRFSRKKYITYFFLYYLVVVRVLVVLGVVVVLVVVVVVKSEC